MWVKSSLFSLVLTAVNFWLCTLGRCVQFRLMFSMIIHLQKMVSEVSFSSAVQSERKPIEVMPREKHINCAASTQKIYIRKDLNSPLIATPTFISDSETDASRSVSFRVDWGQTCALCTTQGLFLLMLFKPRVVNDLCRSSLLEQGMLVNIQQPVIQSDGTLLLATDSKVQLQMSCALGRFTLHHRTSPSFYVLCFFVL